MSATSEKKDWLDSALDSAEKAVDSFVGAVGGLHHRDKQYEDEIPDAEILECSSCGSNHQLARFTVKRTGEAFHLCSQCVSKARTTKEISDGR